MDEVLMQFWLLQRLCGIIELRNEILRTPSAILRIMSLMRAANMEGGASLELLSPFCFSSTFLDMSLTNSQVLQHFEYFFRHDDSKFVQQCAFDILLIFAEGLKLSSSASAIAKDFIDSGILFTLVNVISEGHAEIQQNGTILLSALLHDKMIREFFLVEPLAILHCLNTTLDSFESKSKVIMSLVIVLETVVRDSSSFSRLFQSNIVVDIKEFVKNVLSSDLSSDSDHVKYIQPCLNVFDAMASSSESHSYFKQLKMEEFLKLLLHHDNNQVRDTVSRILLKLGSNVTPQRWGKLFSQLSSDH